MKKIGLSLVFVLFFMMGCSNISNDIKEESQALITLFFDQMNGMETYDNDADLESLHQYFTSDSNVKNTLSHYLTRFESERQKELVNNVIKKIKMDEAEGYFRATITFDIVSKNNGTVLYEDSTLNVYLNEDQGQLKIQTADFGG